MRIVSVKPGRGVRLQDSVIRRLATESVQMHILIYTGTGAIASVILETGYVKSRIVASLFAEGGLVTRRLVVFGSIGSLIVALAAIFYETRGDPRPDPRSPLPDPSVARRAVETITRSLARFGDETETTRIEVEPLVFVDHQRRPGQRLRAFAVRGEFELETCRCFKVRLDLAEPDESILATYYVFGQDPMWVYRAEDFDMIMHWEMNMPEPRKPPRPLPIPSTSSKSKSEPDEPGKAQAVTGKAPLGAG